MGHVVESLCTGGRLLRGQAPGQLIIQLTDRCNARCPQCGMRVLNRYPRKRLEKEYVKRLLDAGARRGMRMVSFTGGEPFLLLNDLVELINYAGRAGYRYIRTGTNGFLFRYHQEVGFIDKVHRLAERLAATPLRNLWFSIDSSEPATHDSMRGFPDVLKGIEKALPIFHAHGIYPSANVGLNRNLTQETTSLAPLEGDGVDEGRFSQAFSQGFDRLYRLIIDMGFTLTSACYPMSIEPGESGLQAVYAATGSERIVRFDQQEKILLYRALFAAVEKYRARIRIVTPLSTLHSMIGHHGQHKGHGYGCRGGSDYLFVDSSDGQTYPCGYRGNEGMGKLWELDEAKVAANRKSDCRRCDWECFRDPSELFGPMIRGLSRPWQLTADHYRDPDFLRFWLQDIRYARACNLFDGRKKTDYARLGGFAGSRGGNASAPETIALVQQGRAVEE
nr:radical SAM protein [uncultured Desulfobulbus sp.]